MKQLKVLSVIGAVLGVIGFCVIGSFAGWWVAGGVFMMICGNNFERVMYQQ